MFWGSIIKYKVLYFDKPEIIDSSNSGGINYHDKFRKWVLYSYFFLNMPINSIECESIECHELNSYLYSPTLVKLVGPSHLFE